MKLKYIYAVICLFGTILPFLQFIPWVIENGLDIPLFVQELFSTRIGAFFGLDVIVSAVALFVFIYTESKRIQMPYFWVPMLATLSVGVSLGLPWFLYMRLVHLEKRA
ncbi:DUF2834 domain-containing protein [Gynuella sp.]|uniref:DUF2834 domain-containing protein n=1 Tax=Gynuella sp. TaxID=2969146 RepID=UPI003D128C00